MSSPQSVIVPPALAGPLDRAVRVLFGASWNKARDWIAAGKVTVAGTVIIQATSRVTAGDELCMNTRARRVRAGELEDSAVVHVDAHVIVVRKPPGISTVPYDDSETDTLEARVRAWLERHGKSPRGARPALGIVHRLDKETSGLVVFARSWLAKKALAGQFRAHSVHRIYLSVAHGDVRSRTLRSFLMADRGDGIRGSAHGRPPSEAREAITHVRAIEALRGATLAVCKLETGRTHQIRIHLSEAGHPLLGERVYVRHYRGPILESPRLMLHASELGFVHPATERDMLWQQPMPEDMSGVVEALRT
jgi:23S rRNA pseudouridine1911/1915/1917 synthase